jgi:XTP/dITP diphosphohydrolase
VTHGLVHQLLIATSNRGKLEEFRALFQGQGLRVVGATDVLKEPLHVVEDGATFEANALKKATSYAQACMMMTLADDSGLEVDALEGRPGVHSARFAHERATDAENNAALLSLVGALDDRTPGAHQENHRARFRCVLALVDPFFNDGDPIVVEGRCEGSLTRTPRGSGGFGYDPLFVVDGTEKTLAELTEEEKNLHSHRARAVHALRPELERVIQARNDAVARILRT